MAILTKRNAVLGWITWQVAKRVGKRKVKQAAPRRDDDTKVPKKGLVSALAAVGGALWFWRRKRGSED
jgi:hypothetical protein